jgi:hypothetical protein
MAVLEFLNQEDERFGSSGCGCSDQRSGEIRMSGNSLFRREVRSEMRTWRKRCILRREAGNRYRRKNSGTGDPGQNMFIESPCGTNILRLSTMVVKWVQRFRERRVLPARNPL